MNAHDHDPIFGSLDRLADLADRDAPGDRMPDIHRRVCVARRRRTAGAGIAALAVLAGGTALWQVLPGDDKVPPPTPPRQDLKQTVLIDAVPDAGNHLELSLTIEGTSSAYVDPETGDAIPAGAQSVVLRVDGERYDRFAGTGGDCEPGGEVSSYAASYPARRTLSVYVDGPGEHTLEVSAPYCADGELVDEPTSVTVVTEPDPPTVTERDADVDGDGSSDTVRLSVPAETSGADTMRLTVTWAAGGTARLDLPYAVYSDLEEPRDLDGDGGAEVVVNGTSGGDSATWWVVRELDGRLVRVPTVDASGAEAELLDWCTECGGGPQNVDWVTTLRDDGFFDYRFVDAQPVLPAPVEVRRWVLSGDTLTREATASPGCLRQPGGLSLGGC